MRAPSPWAARYQFTFELWKGAARLVIDPSLERALGSGESFSPEVRALLDDLLPAGGGGRDLAATWMGMERGRMAAQYARRFGGVIFGDLEAATSFAEDEDWQCALVDLGGLLDDAGPGEDPSLETRLRPALAAALESIGEHIEDEGRRLVLSAPADDVAGVRGVSLDRFVEYIDETFGGARVYALASAPMVAVFEIDRDADEDDDLEAEEPEEDTAIIDTASRSEDGDDDAYDAELDEAEATWSQGPGPRTQVQLEGDELEEPTIDLETSLASAEPKFIAFVAVVDTPNAAHGVAQVTYVELPGPADEAPASPAARESEGADAAGLRAQLAQAQRQAELLALEKQRLLEELEEAHDELDALADPESTVSGRHNPDGEQMGSDGQARLDAALAQAQELRWRVRELEGRNAELLARPVSELEASHAQLQAELDALRSSPAAAARPKEHQTTTRSRTASTRREEAPRPPRDEPQPDASVGWIGELVARVDGLLRRVERGGLPALELHASLKKLRHRLTRRR